MGMIYKICRIYGYIINGMFFIMALMAAVTEIILKNNADILEEDIAGVIILLLMSISSFYFLYRTRKFLVESVGYEGVEVLDQELVHPPQLKFRFARASGVFNIIFGCFSLFIGFLFYFDPKSLGLPDEGIDVAIESSFNMMIRGMVIIFFLYGITSIIYNVGMLRKIRKRNN